MIFGWSQIVIDIQPLVVLLLGEGHLHGISHTYLGATLLAVVAALTGKHLAEFGLAVLGIARDNPITMTWPIAFFSAFVGTYSHVVLDSVMHGDLQPFYPFSLANPLLGKLDYDELHQFCIYSGLGGGVLFFIVQLTLARRGRKAECVDESSE